MKFMLCAACYQIFFLHQYHKTTAAKYFRFKLRLEVAEYMINAAYCIEIYRLILENPIWFKFFAITSKKYINAINRYYLNAVIASLI